MFHQIKELILQKMEEYGMLFPRYLVLDEHSCEKLYYRGYRMKFDDKYPDVPAGWQSRGDKGLMMKNNVARPCWNCGCITC